MIRANFHIHSTYCDGKNTPEEIVKTAIAQGITALGFSGHAYNRYEPYSMKPDAFPQYRSEILQLKDQYRKIIQIYLGIEEDATCEPEDYPVDYKIGSIHGLFAGGDYISVDESEAIMVHNVESYFHGDYYAYTEAYYQTLATTVLRHDPTFIGHFDLVTKFNEGYRYFDEMNPRYYDAAMDALDELSKAGKPFEINTGAISRGYRTSPYPAPFLLRRIREKGGRIILSGDSHSADSLLCGYHEATDLAKACGFTHALILTENGFTEINL